MFLRSWTTFCVVIGVVQLILSVLSVLQHDTILSDLLRQRISVMAQTTAASFKPIVDLGLPLSTIRNGDSIVARPKTTDPAVRAVHVFTPTGAIAYSTDPAHPDAISNEILQTMRSSGGVRWSLETSDQLYSGFNVVRRDGQLAGAVVVSYPKRLLHTASQVLAGEVARAAFATWVGFSLLSYIVLRLMMWAPQQRLQRIDDLARGDADGASASDPSAPILRAGFWGRLFESELRQLSHDLSAARGRYVEAQSDLAALVEDGDGTSTLHTQGPVAETAIAANPSRSLARRIAARLAPAAAVMIVLSAILLGLITLSVVNRSVEPELAARTNLIATVVGEDVQRAVAAGAPLDQLVDAESYFSEMLKQMPEIAYVAIATGRVVLEAGKPINPYVAPPSARNGVLSHPILEDGKQIAYVVIDVDPAFIAKKFADVFLDMGVIVAVAILIAYEVMVLLSSRSLTAALDRLQRLATMQAAGDFSKRVAAGTRTSVDRATGLLVRRAEQLNSAFADAFNRLGTSAALSARLADIGQRFGLSARGTPTLLRFSYFTDLRLALFLFAAADEMPLSFMPLYTRAAYNPIPWLPQSVLISLPLAAYLCAIVLVSPYARPLSARLGPRRLLLLAAIPTLAAHLWLFVAASVPEIIAARLILGAGYAVVTLACQDYVIDNTPRDERDRSLGIFSTVLFGGIFCGTALGGVLADRLGQANVFLISAALVTMSALLIFSLLEDTGGRRTVAVVRPPLLASLANLRFAALVFGIALPSNIVLQAFVSYTVALSLDRLGASPADIGRTLMVYFLAVALVGPLSGRAAERGVPLSYVAVVGAIIPAAALLVAAMWPTQVTIFVAVLASGIGSGMVRGAQVSLAVSLAETDLQKLGVDAVLGALRTIERFGSIAGLVVVAAIAGLYGYVAATTLVAALLLGGLIVFGLAEGLGRPRVEQAAQ